MKIAEVRRFALSLPESSEAPHFDYASFRVRGKIFATVPPGERYLHVFVDEPERERMAVRAPATYEKLWWGKKVVGLRLTLSRARRRDVEELLRSAWHRKAPKDVLRAIQGLRRESEVQVRRPTRRQSAAPGRRRGASHR